MKLEKLPKHAGIYRRCHDRRYVVRIMWTEERTGKRREAWRVLPKGATVAAAVALRETLTRDIKLGGVEVEALPTLDAYAQAWVRRKVALGEWREGATTADRATHVLTAHVRPSLGSCRIDHVTARRIQAWMTAQLLSGAAPATVRHRWSVLRSMVRDLCREHGLTDPCTGVRAPKKVKRGGRAMVLERSERRALVAELRERSPRRWYLFAVLGFESGARFSELAAAQVRDLDVSGEVGLWHVCRHVVQGEDRPGTKSGPERRIYLSPQATRVLRPHLEARRALGGVSARVFPGERPFAPLGPRGCNRALLRACAAARVPPVSSKAFRQAYATESARLKLGDIVQDQLGHTTAEMTSVYERFSDTDRKRAAEAMGAALGLGPDLEGAATPSEGAENPC